MNAKKKTVFLSLFVMVILSIYFISIKNINYAQSKNSRQSIYPVKGFGVMLEQPTGSLHRSSIINLKENKEFNYNVKFINNTEYDKSFILIVFLDYYQIPFYLEGNEKLKNTHEFNIKKGEEKIIPIRFPVEHLSSNSHALVFSMLTGPEKHASELKFSTQFYGITTRYNLQVASKNKTKNVLQKEMSTYLFKPENQFSGILVNQNINLKTKMELPPVKINAKPGDKINFALRAGGYPDTEDYVAWVIVGWNQVSWDKNQKYWNFKIPKSQVAFKQISITAPKEKGDYEVVAYLAANPEKQLADNLPQNIGIDTSYRFTLHVD